MKVSIIHPSRGRWYKAVNTARKWIGNFGSDDDSIEYIFSLDITEEAGTRSMCFKHIAELAMNYPNINFKIEQNDNHNVVDAMNAGAKVSSGSLLVCISDDFDCPQLWLSKILSYINIPNEEALLVNQGIEKFKTNMALPILTKPLYKKLGFIYYPEYTGMFADDDLTQSCMIHGKVIRADNLIFQHNHFVNGKAQMDDTYKRHNNNISYMHGEILFEKRRLKNFPCL